MARFLTPLDVRQVDSHQWQLSHPLSYRSHLLGGVVSVPSGFMTDFASTPRLLLAYWLAGRRPQAPAIVHDYLYAHTRVLYQFPVGDRRAVADRVFLEALRVVGVPAWRRTLMYRAVRLLGGLFWGR